MDAKARLDEIRDKLLERTRAKLEIDYSGRGVLTVNDVMQILLEAGVTLPPQPAGPVTSASTLDAARDVLHAPMFTHPDMALKQRYDFDHKVAPKIAKDHGLLTPAEVERRAREWVDGWRMSPAFEGELIRALTAPTGKEGV